MVLLLLLLLSLWVRLPFGTQNAVTHTSRKGCNLTLKTRLKLELQLGTHTRLNSVAYLEAHLKLDRKLKHKSKVQSKIQQ